MTPAQKKKRRAQKRRQREKNRETNNTVMRFYSGIGTLKFSNNHVERLPMRLGEFGTNTGLHMQLDFVLPDGGTPPVGNDLYGKCLALIKEVRITLNGSDDTLRISGPELMAVHTADCRGLPFGFSNPPLASGKINFHFNIDHLLKNSDNPWLTGMDFRNERKIERAEIEVTWGTISDLYDTPNDMTVSGEIEVFQGGLKNYLSPVIKMVKVRDRSGQPETRADGTFTNRKKARRIDPFVRHFDVTETKISQDQASVEIARILNTTNRSYIKAIYLIGLVDKGTLSGEMFGTNIEIRQGQMQHIKAPVLGLLEDHRRDTDYYYYPGILYIPLSNSFESSSHPKQHIFKDDMEILADVKVPVTGDNPRIRVIVERYRQELER